MRDIKINEFPDETDVSESPIDFSNGRLRKHEMKTETILIKTPSNNPNCKEHLFSAGKCINCGKIHPIMIALKEKELNFVGIYKTKAMGCSFDRNNPNGKSIYEIKP